MVNSAPGFTRLRPERGAHARSAEGMAELPFGIPVEIEGEAELLV